MGRSTAPFAGRVAVVTGAGSGIGRALALALARQGATLALSDIDVVGLDATAGAARAVGATVRADQVDVSDYAAVVAYADTVAAELGVVNLVINNAGIGHTGDVLDLDLADFNRVMNVDFWGVVHGSKAFLPHLIESGAGHLVNVSSMFGLVSVPGQSAYSAAKYASRGFTEALRMEMLAARHPVAVTCVHPGFVKTGLVRNSTFSRDLDGAALAEEFETKLARTTPERAASIILRAAAAGRGRVLIGGDARALHWFGLLTGAGYQRVVSAGARRAAVKSRNAAT